MTERWIAVRQQGGFTTYATGDAPTTIHQSPQRERARRFDTEEEARNVFACVNEGEARLWSVEKVNN